LEKIMSNALSFSGNLGSDAEVRYTPNGTAVLQFSVAMSSGYGDKKKTEWVRCSQWGKVAESTLKDYLKKGTAVFVTGEMSLNTYQANDNTVRTSINLTCHSIDLISGKKQETNSAPPPKPPANKPPAQKGQPPNMDDVPYDDDIPF
jgi:single-strand DNA-binding protein